MAQSSFHGKPRLSSVNAKFCTGSVWQGNTAGLGIFPTREVKTRPPQLTHRTMVSPPLFFLMLTRMSMGISQQAAVWLSCLLVNSRSELNFQTIVHPLFSDLVILCFKTSAILPNCTEVAHSNHIGYFKSKMPVCAYVIPCPNPLPPPPPSSCNRRIPLYPTCRDENSLC